MTVKILIGDCREMLRTLPEQSVHCCVTSPPYFGLRDYGVAGQIGLEPTPDAFVAEMVQVFREVRRVLRDDGTLWLNLGDSYATGTKAPRKPTTIAGPDVPASWAGRSQPERCGTPDGYKTKDLLGIPWMVALALRADGWWLRSSIIWHKPNPMPESVRDRPTSAHENIFLLAKSERYWFDAEAVKEPAKYPGDNRAARTDTRKAIDPLCSDNGSRARTGSPTAELINIRNVWTVPTQPFSDAHFATFPPALIEPCIKAGCPAGGTVLDPFGGAGTTGLVADRLQRNAILIELNPAYAAMAERRIASEAGMFASVEAVA